MNGKGKNELFELVHGLESHEKAYYKKMAKRYAHNNDSLHLRLFDLIEKTKDHDDSNFKTELGIRNSAQYSGLKKYLWNDLLSTLTFAQRLEPSIKLQLCTVEIENLIGKNLIDSAAKVIDTAWPLAVQHELYPIQQSLLHLKYKILAYASHKRFKAESEKLLIDQTTVLERMHTEQRLQLLLRELIAFRQFTYLRFSTGQLERIREIESELLNLHSEQNSLLSLLKYCGLCVATHLAYRFRESEAHAEQLLNTWKAKTGLIKHNGTLFLSSADYTFYNAFALKKVDSAAYYLREYLQLAASFLQKSDFDKWEIIAFNTQLKIYHKTARYDKVGMLIESRAGIIIDLAGKILPPAMAMSVICSICISYFVLDNFDRAEDLLLDIVNINHTVEREDILYFTATFYLLILFEKKNYLQLSNAITSTYFKLYNKKKLQPFERDLMLFLKHLSGQTNNKAKRKIIAEFLIKLEAYKNDPVKDLYFLYFNYHGWLESKTLSIKYSNYMKEKISASLPNPQFKSGM